jgi:energy-converting hydrogenase Eha subunit E
MSGGGGLLLLLAQCRQPYSGIHLRSHHPAHHFPVPVSATVCGEPVALSVSTIDAVRVPAAVGLNSTGIVQLAPAAKVPPAQVPPERRNELALVPVKFAEVRVIAVALVFLTVITCAAVVEPIAVEANVRLDGLRETVNPAAAPVPLSATVWGEPAALSVSTRDAVSVPAAVGLNSTGIVQLAPAAKVPPAQVPPDRRKELALVPAKFAEVRVMAVALVFLTVITCAAVVEPIGVEAKVKLAGLRETVSPAAAPVPLSATVCGEPTALSVSTRDAVSVPAAVGLNSTGIVQLAPAANVPPAQVPPDRRNELALAPAKFAEVKVIAVALVFLTVITCAAVVEPIGVEAKVRLDGLRETVNPAAAPVPVRATV